MSCFASELICTISHPAHRQVRTYSGVTVTTADFFLQQQIGNVANECRHRMGGIARAATIAEVRRQVDVPIPALIRSLTHMIPELRQLKANGELRVDQLLRAKLAEIESLPASEQVAELEDFREKWLSALRGDFARLYVGTERIVIQRLHAFKSVGT